MLDESLLTVSLPPGDWQILHAALYELPMKIAAPVVQRLQAALAEAQKPPRSAVVEVPRSKRDA